MSSTQVLGQVAGSAGTVAPGPIVSLPVSGPGYLSEVTATLREGSDSTNGLSPLGGGAVLVEMQLAPGTATSAAWASPARWRRASYVGTSIGVAYHPNILLRVDEQLTLSIRVFARDNIRTTRVIVDVGYHVTMAPVGASDWDPCPEGQYQSGTGHLRVVTGGNPAAGAEIAVTVPTGLRWRFHQLSFRLASSAGAANRWVGINRTIGGVTTGAPSGVEVMASAARTASKSGDYSIHRGAPRDQQIISGVWEFFGLPLPEEWDLPSGGILATSTTNLQAGDDFSAPVMVVEEWVVPGVGAS